MLESFIKGFIFTPAYACVVYAVIFFTNWSKLRISQRVFTIWLVIMINYYLMTTCLLLGDQEAYSHLMLTDSFIAPFIIVQSFLFIYSQLHSESLFKPRIMALILIPITILVLALINYCTHGNDTYYQVAAFMIEDNIPYPRINFLFRLLTLLYDIVVIGGSVFVIIYTIIKIQWYEREAQKYAADSYSKILPMRGQMTMFLFLIVASMGILPLIHFLNKEDLLIYCPIYYFMLTVLLVNTCRKIHHGYKPIGMEGEEMEETDKEKAFYEDVFSNIVANSQNATPVNITPTDVQTAIPEQEATAASVNAEEGQKEEEKEKVVATTAVKEKVKAEKPTNNLIDYVSATAIAERLNELMMTKKLYLQQDITIKDVASAIGTNSSYLSIYLNRMLDMSFSEYINKLRIEKAVLPLLKADPETPTKELILAGNFAHRTSFYRAFQKVTGETFMDYRDKLLSNEY